MKTLLSLFVLLITTLIGSAQNKTSITAGDQRIEKIINANWAFNYFPSEAAGKGYEATGFDDSRWSVISIPHTWSTFETTGELHPFIMNASESDDPYWWKGWGWYRKHFSIDQMSSGKKIFVEFEGVQKYCKVWLNGRYLGDHKGGYGSFDFDITSFVKLGGDNVLAIAVNNNRNDEFHIPPMSAGNFNVYGGIYRDVTIVLKNRIYIPMQGSAAHEGGVFVTTPDLNEKSGVVRIQTWVKNDYEQPGNFILQTSLIDQSGKLVQVIKSAADIKTGELYKFDQVTKTIKSPHLWSPQDPYLYKVVSEVTDGKTTRDKLETIFGFRWFRWNYTENMLYVNGSKVILHGGNRHQEYPWLGDAIPKWITLMDLKDIHDNLGYNFMRTAHYPNDIIVYDQADKLGIIIDEESPNIKNLEFSTEVQQQQIKEMIRRDRNHPSIMFWSMGNETDHAVDSRFAVAEDTTRILTARRVVNGSQGKYARHNDDNLPIENLLRCTIRGWYNSDIKNLEPQDGQQSGTEEHQLNMLRNSGLFGNGNLITWIYADHGADREYVNSPLLHVNPKGYVDMYREPKYSYYFWQANYSQKPMIFILPHFWRSIYKGQIKNIAIVSNCDKIELKVNGISKGIKNPDASNYHYVVFPDVRIEDGVLSATGTKNGYPVTTQITLAGEPARIVLRTSHEKIQADMSSVVVVTADAVDSQGNHVYGASNTLKWEIIGPGTLVGPAVYASEINKKQEKGGVWYMDMPVSNVIRSKGIPGKIKVKVFASGLASGTVEIECVKPEQNTSVISETALSGEGRKMVARNILESRRLDNIPSEFTKANEGIKLSASDLKGYKNAFKEFVKKSNPSCDTACIEFRAFAEVLGNQFLNNNGNLSAEDYNYNVDNYNNCRLIGGYINATKLPQLFKEGLKDYYSDLIIRKGNMKDAGDEMNWLNWIPSGGTVIIYSGIEKQSYPKGTLISGKNELADLISAVHPGFPGFSPEAKERALEFIFRMNPYVHAVSDANETVTKYLAEKGKPVLIPLYKFIAE